LYSNHNLKTRQGPDATSCMPAELINFPHWYAVFMREESETGDDSIFAAHMSVDLWAKTDFIEFTKQKSIKKTRLCDNSHAKS